MNILIWFCFHTTPEPGIGSLNWLDLKALKILINSGKRKLVAHGMMWQQRYSECHYRVILILIQDKILHDYVFDILEYFSQTREYTS